MHPIDSISLSVPSLQSDPYEVPLTPVRYLRLIARTRRIVREITPIEFYSFPPEQRPLLIDVREFSEWRAGRAEGALHISRGIIEQRIESVVPELHQPMVCYCADGCRSILVAAGLRQLGYRDVRSLDGGFSAWEDAGLPVVGRSAWD